MHLGEGDPRGPPFRLRAFPAFSRRRKAADKPMRVCRRPFRVRGLLRGPRGSPAAFCMPPTRVARFWRVGALRGSLWFDALGVRCLSPAPCAAFALAVALVGKPPERDFVRRPCSLFGASEGAVEAPAGGVPWPFGFEFCLLRLFGACMKGIWVLACEPYALAGSTQSW